jgi:hypothetical protein
VEGEVCDEGVLSTFCLRLVVVMLSTFVIGEECWCMHRELVALYQQSCISLGLCKIGIRSNFNVIEVSHSQSSSQLVYRTIINSLVLLQSTAGA